MSGTVARSLGALGDALGGTANVNFDAGTLFVDSVNNRVGIGTASPTAACHVLGTLQSQSGSSFAQMYSDGGAAFFTSVGAFPSIFLTNNVERMRIDASGRVTRPFQPAFAAHGGSGITTTSSTQTCIFNTTTTNVGSHYNTSNGKFTAPVAGLYHFTWFISQNAGATGPVAYILVNGSGVFAGAISYGTSYNNACASVVVSLNANDFVSVGVVGFNNSFSFVDFGYSGFSGFLI